MNNSIVCKYGFYASGLKGTRIPCNWIDIFKSACLAQDDTVPVSDFFLSMYRYPDSWRDYCKRNNGSSAGYNGEVFCKFLWFDVDREGDLPAALADTARLVEWLTRTPDGQLSDECGAFVPYTDSLLIFFSGSKGFHIGIPIEVFGAAAVPGVGFAGQVKAVALAMAKSAGIEIDRAVYDKQRLFRCPNTIHGKTGLFKIPVSFWELTGVGDLGRIQERARRPRPLYFELSRGVDLALGSCTDSVRFVPPDNPVPAAKKYWETVIEAETLRFGTGGERREDTDEPETGYRCCVQSFPGSDSSFPRVRRSTFEYIRQGVGQGQRAVSLYKSAADCARCGWNDEAIWSLLPDVARKTGLGIGEIQKQIIAGIKEGRL